MHRNRILHRLALLVCVFGILAGSVRAFAYQAPAMATASFHQELAEGNDSVRIDLSDSANGVLALTVRSSKKCKFQTIKGEQTYTYDVPSDGTPTVFPIQCGDGHYTFRVVENVTGTKYAMLYVMEADVKLTDEYQPFLRPSAYANYTADSACVKKAAELAKNEKDVSGVIGAVYKYVCGTVVYDYDKAKTVQSGYLPVPDETMSTGKGICFDYASLAASMLRSQGIPTKLVFGYVAPNDLYHAWNMFYTKETGWVTVSFEISPNRWNRMDLTFAANGTDGNFIGDGSNYTDVYYY